MIAEVQQKSTQKGGVRPYGISCFLTGFWEGKPRFFQTEPSGAYQEWKANAIGKKSKELREYLEEKVEDNMNNEKTINLAISTLLECVESHKSMEICVITNSKEGQVTTYMGEEEVKVICDSVNEAKEAAKAAKKKV
jgi:20S proteasome alpha/beta subunit